MHNDYKIQSTVKSAIIQVLIISVFRLKAVVTIGNTTNAEDHVTNPPSWGYKEVIDEIPPLAWERRYPTCVGARQSPIHIHTHQSEVDRNLGAIKFRNYKEQPEDGIWTILNNGHTVQLSANFTNSPFIRRGGMSSSYVLTQFHFHWGSSSSHGSEHRVDWKFYPLELHIVHRRVNEDDPESLADPLGLAVVAVLFSLAEKPNAHIDKLVKAISKEKIPLHPVNLRLDGFNLAELLPDSNEYFRYLGSLTTPPCAQSVIWSIMRKPMPVTERQLKIFRSLHERPDTAEPIEDNDRPIQDTDGRIVKLFANSKNAFL